mmetsp:Transcript_21254/g.62050  ORF Transcript_21254/g.62050 Transcript_21254/m.62050 type:complete len:331 (-) Transcript_21254:87-1079(-)
MWVLICCPFSSVITSPTLMPLSLPRVDGFTCVTTTPKGEPSTDTPSAPSPRRTRSTLSTGGGSWMPKMMPNTSPASVLASFSLARSCSSSTEPFLACCSRATRSSSSSSSSSSSISSGTAPQAPNAARSWSCPACTGWGLAVVWPWSCLEVAMASVCCGSKCSVCSDVVPNEGDVEIVSRRRRSWLRGPCTTTTISSSSPMRSSMPSEPSSLPMCSSAPCAGPRRPRSSAVPWSASSSVASTSAIIVSSMSPSSVRSGTKSSVRANWLNSSSGSSGIPMSSGSLLPEAPLPPSSSSSSPSVSSCTAASSPSSSSWSSPPRGTCPAPQLML